MKIGALMMLTFAALIATPINAHVAPEVRAPVLADAASPGSQLKFDIGTSGEGRLAYPPDKPFANSRHGDPAHHRTNPRAVVIERSNVTATDRHALRLAPGGGAAVRFASLGR